MLFSTAITLLGSLLCANDDGQGSAAPGANLAQLDAGRYVFGVEFEPAKHVGEVVLVVFGGS